MKYRRFFIFIVELVAVCSAILFIPVMTVREVYASQSASIHANLISGYPSDRLLPAIFLSFVMPTKVLSFY